MPRVSEVTKLTSTGNQLGLPVTTRENGVGYHKVKLTLTSLYLCCVWLANCEGIMAVVTVGVALGVIAGGVLLICAAKYLKR